MPKGVMWRQDDLFNVLGAGGNALLGMPPATVGRASWRRASGARAPAADIADRLPADARHRPVLGPDLRQPAAARSPTLPSRRFNAVELWDEVAAAAGAPRSSSSARRSPTPMLAALDANPGRWDLSTRAADQLVGRRCGARRTSRACCATCPQAMLFDSFGSSEAVGLGVSASAPGAEARPPRSCSARTARCSPRTAGGSQPGSGERGMVAVSGFIPLGYYKDEEKTAQDVPDHRGPALERARRLRRGQRRRHAAPARPRLGVHQHRRREGLPRRGRGGAEDATRPCATPSSSACPTSASAR